MIKVSDLFEVVYGVNLEFQNMEVCKNGIPFVSRTEKNNGVVAFVKKIDEIEPNPKNTISVACGGSVMESFLQTKEYYSGRDLFYLKPKVELTEKQMLYYCMCLRANKYRYSYGRQANKTLANILIPAPEKIPDYIAKVKIKEPSKEPLNSATIDLNVSKWKSFNYEAIFEILGGYYNKKPDEVNGGAIPFIGATEYNNGITSFHDIKTIANSSKDGSLENHSIKNKIFDGDKYITVSNDGSVGCAFFQPVDFTCSHSVNPIMLKNYIINKYIAMFLCTLICLEKYRWAYGRKWRPFRMPKSKIKLPTTPQGEPDWEFMENYIKSLPYSASL